MDVEARRSLLRLSRDLAEVGDALGSIASALPSAGSLRRRDLRALKGIGVLMVALPDPFTSLAGAGILLLARRLSRDGVEDLVDASLEVLRSLRELRGAIITESAGGGIRTHEGFRPQALGPPDSRPAP